MKNKNVNLGEGSVGKLLINLAVPAIIAQMVNLLYNIVDRIFIGRMANGENCHGWYWSCDAYYNDYICI